MKQGKYWRLNSYCRTVWTQLGFQRIRLLLIQIGAIRCTVITIKCLNQWIHGNIRSKILLSKFWGRIILCTLNLSDCRPIFARRFCHVPPANNFLWKFDPGDTLVLGQDVKLILIHLKNIQKWHNSSEWHTSLYLCSSKIGIRKRHRMFDRIL